MQEFWALNPWITIYGHYNSSFVEIFNFHQTSAKSEKNPSAWSWPTTTPCLFVRLVSTPPWNSEGAVTSTFMIGSSTDQRPKSIAAKNVNLECSLHFNAPNQFLEAFFTMQTISDKNANLVSWLLLLPTGKSNRKNQQHGWHLGSITTLIKIDIKAVNYFQI